MSKKSIAHRVCTACLGITIALVAAGPLAAQFDDEDPYDPAEEAERIIALIEEAIDRADSRSSVLAGLDPKDMRPEVRKAARTIKMLKVTFTLEDQEVPELLTFLTKVSGLNFAMSGKAREAVEESRPTISLDLKNLRLENVLNLVTAQLRDFRFVIRYGVVMLVTREEYRPKHVLRIYEMRDLLYRPRDFKAPRLGLGGVEDDGGGW